MSADLLERAMSEGIPVDEAEIEKTLGKLWSSQKEAPATVTRAALWNVVAHTLSPEAQENAIEVLGRVAASIPQRAIVVRAERQSGVAMAASIRAVCQLAGDRQRVCSEVISISAGGERVDRLPPLVNALLLPDMPVAVWWEGDLPHGEDDFVNALLEPADRLIVDASRFDDLGDLQFVEAIAARTQTAPADLSWLRLEPWRIAAASLFDCPELRSRAGSVERLRIEAGAAGTSPFGARIQPFLFAAWLMAQTGVEADDIGALFSFDIRDEAPAGLIRVELEVGGMDAVITQEAGRCVMAARVDGREGALQSVTRASRRSTEQLIVRELARPRPDPVLLKVLPVALRLARELAQ